MFFFIAVGVSLIFIIDVVVDYRLLDFDGRSLLVIFGLVFLFSGASLEGDYYLVGFEGGRRFFWLRCAFVSGIGYFCVFVYLFLDKFWYKLGMSFG